MKNILVTLDFQSCDSTLLDKAAELAGPLNSKVWIVHIAAPDPDFVGFKEGPKYIRSMRAEELREEHKQLQEHSKSLKEKGINAESLLVQGETIATILEEADKLKADMIITGHHKHSFLYNAIVDSVSTQIVRQSSIPILLVPAKD